MLQSPQTFFEMVKVDVEGFEIRALRGMAKLIQEKRVGALFVEIGPARWARAGITLETGVAELQNMFLASHDYDMFLSMRGDAACPDMRAEIPELSKSETATFFSLVILDL